MRVVVISDVHARLAELQRVLADIDAATTPDELWCLGDVVGLGGSDAAEVVDVVRERCAVVLAGNHDAWVTGALSLDLLPLPRQRVELEGQRAELAGSRLDWLARLPAYLRHAGVELWHGSAEDPVTGWVATDADAKAHLEHQRARIGLVGHTHRAAVGRLEEGAISWNQPPPERVSLRQGGRWLLNPGPVITTGSWMELDLKDASAVWHRAIGVD